MEMKSIFDQALREFVHETRSYTRTVEPNEYTDPPVARFKAVIYLKNNKSLWYYSYDFTKSNGNSYINELQGLNKLIRLINRKQGTFKTAIIYANLEARPLPGSKYDLMIAKFSSNNTYVERNELGFRPQGENCFLDLYSLSNLPKSL